MNVFRYVTSHVKSSEKQTTNSYNNSSASNKGKYNISYITFLVIKSVNVFELPCVNITYHIRSCNHDSSALMNFNSNSTIL